MNNLVKDNIGVVLTSSSICSCMKYLLDQIIHTFLDLRHKLINLACVAPYLPPDRRSKLLSY